MENDYSKIDALKSTTIAKRLSQPRMVREPLCYCCKALNHLTAIASISTKASFGKVFTAKDERAGKVPVNF